jgi:hypothetical protein
MRYSLLVCNRVSLMTKSWLKWSLISCGIIFLCFLAGLMLLVADFGGHTKTRLIRESASPNGQVIASAYEVITPMHGGPDSVQVTLRPSTFALGDIIYSEAFECGPDYSAFQFEWQSPSRLTVSYGICDAGRYRSATDNKILRKIGRWQEVSIVYRESGHVAHANP